MTNQAVDSLKNINPPQLLALNLIIFIAYVGGGQIGHWLQGPNTAAPLIWIPAGIGVAVLLMFGLKIMPGIIAGSFVTVLLQQTSFNNFNIIFGIPIQSIAHPLQAYIAYHALSKFEDVDTLFSTRSGIKSFFYLGVLFSAIISATLGVLALSINGAIPLGIYNTAWLNWWSADVLGVLVVSPLIISAMLIYLSKSFQIIRII